MDDPCIIRWMVLPRLPAACTVTLYVPHSRDRSFMRMNGDSTRRVDSPTVQYYDRVEEFFSILPKRAGYFREVECAFLFQTVR